VAKQLILPNPRNEALQNLYDKELSRLNEPGALEERLTEIDKIRSFHRIYVMGCGRSGTWLLTNLMGTFQDTDVVRKETVFEYFGLLVTSCSTLVLKRDKDAYRRVAKLPESIKIAYIIRHPFDVLTSHLPRSNRPYHILPDRWLGEMAALRHLVDAGRANTKIIRYEDLASKPVETQTDLGDFFDLRAGMTMSAFYTFSNNPTEKTATTGSPRTIDIDSINKHQRDPKKLDYLKAINPKLGKMLEWVGQTHNYDVSL